MEPHKQYNLPTFEEAQKLKPIVADFELKQSNILRTAKDLNIKNQFIVDNSETTQMKGQRFGRTYITSVLYTLATTDYLVAVGNLITAPTYGLPLPSLVGVGKNFIIKDEVGGALTTNITVRVDGEKLIDGVATSTIITNYGSKRYYTDGANYFTC